MTVHMLRVEGKNYTLVNRAILEKIDGDAEAIFKHTQKGS